MSVLSQAVSRKPTVNQEYDHQIFLLDTSDGPVGEQSGQSGEETDLSRASTSLPLAETQSVSTTEQQARRKRGLREELIRRKYSKFQESRYSVPKAVREENRDEESDAGPSRGPSASAATAHDPLDSHPEQRGRPQGREDHPLHSAIEVLYENQRGGFMCGMPMFSSKSLLNLDPSAWTNGAFKSSPVDITNAQVPDPSWTWAWKSWYVDMSLDVDEEGWQYSFSFQPYFSWHGTHVWFHSFVRRRRWLRRRIRARNVHGGAAAVDERLKEAHLLNDDYFTINNARNRSPGSSLLTGTNPRSSIVSNRAEQEDEDKTDIGDIGSLVKLLRNARIDREKVEAITSFIDNGGEELVYLADRMPDIMGFFVFQKSRRQLLELLMHRFDEATEKLNRDAKGNKDGVEAEKRRLSNLEAAVDAADKQVKQLQYWSDAQGMVKDGMVKGAIHKDDGWEGLDQSGPSQKSALPGQEAP